MLDDHVSKVEHIGKETVKKLADMRSAAAEVNMGLGVPYGMDCITTGVDGGRRARHNVLSTR